MENKRTDTVVMQKSCEDGGRIGDDEVKEKKKTT